MFDACNVSNARSNNHQKNYAASFHGFNFISVKVFVQLL